MGFFLIMKAEIVRSFIIMRRYWFRTLIGIIIGYGMLLVLIYAIYYNLDTVDEALAGRLTDPAKATNFVLGFIIGLFAFGVVGMFTQGLQDMARTGVLEQLCLSPHGLITNFLARSAVSSFSTVLSSSFMVWLVTFTVGGTLHFDALALVSLFLLTYASLLGFGYMVGGLVLVFKQVGQMAMLMRMGLLAVAMLSSETLLEGKGLAFTALMHALPITDATICIKYVLLDGQADGSVFMHPSFYFLILNGAVWTAAGMLCFKTMENWSRLKGTLGTY